MRILHVSPTYYSPDSVIGGGEKFIVYACRAAAGAAAQRGIDLQQTQLAFGPSPGLYEMSDGVSLAILTGSPWEPHTVSTRELIAHLAQADAVFVHQCLSGTGLLAASHAKLLGKPTFGFDHGGGEHQLVSHSPESGRLFDVFLAQSDYCVGSFQDIEGRVEVLKGPVDCNYYRPDPDIERDPLLVLAVGRLLPHKGFERIVMALPDDCRLVIAGTRFDSDYVQYICALRGASRLEIREGLGDEGIRRLMQQASLFVQSSSHFDYKGRYYLKPELLGLAALEALACGTPALVSSAGALPELRSVTGCRVYADEVSLCSMIREHMTGKLVVPGRQEIHESVRSQYGLEAYGAGLFRVLESMSVAQ